MQSRLINFTLHYYRRVLMTNKAIAFIALSKGKKPKSSEEKIKASGSSKQRASIRLAAKKHKLEVISYATDHCTTSRVNWLTRHSLRTAINQAVLGGHPLIIYDLIKLLSGCPSEETIMRWQYLKELPITIIDAVTALNLESFHKRDILILTNYKTNDSRLTGNVIKFGLKTSDHKSTPPSSKSRKLAQNARTAQAITFAKSLETTIDQLISNLTKSKIKPTPQRIASELNDMGIPARRGGEWTATSVKRVQDRFKEIKK